MTNPYMFWRRVREIAQDLNRQFKGKVVHEDVMILALWEHPLNQPCSAAGEDGLFGTFGLALNTHWVDDEHGEVERLEVMAGWPMHRIFG